MVDWNDFGNYDWIVRSYQKVKEIGRGGCGAVFVVKKTMTGDQYALKVCKTDELENFNILKNEIMNQTQFNHPCIVKAYEFNIELQRNLADLTKIDYYYTFLIMEVGEESVETMIENAPSHILEEGTVINIFWCCIQGLISAKKMKCAHLDFKPPNILRFKNTFKLADWGLSVGAVLDQSQTVRVQGVTPPYDDPEVADIYGNIDPKAKVQHFACDIFALGISVLHMFGIELNALKPIKRQKTNEMLFTSLMQKEIKKAITNSKSKKPKEWQNLLEKCLAMRHKDRWTVEQIEAFFQKNFSGQLGAFQVKFLF